MTNVEEETKGLVGEQVIESETVLEPMTAPPQPEAAPYITDGSRKSIDSKDMQPGSPIVMMPSVGFSEQSLSLIHI